MNKYRILVVDDEESIREFFEIMLKREGYEVFTSSNGRKALDWLKNHQVDLIISDIQMPEMSGMELLAKIKGLDSDMVVLMIAMEPSLVVTRIFEPSLVMPLGLAPDMTVFSMSPTSSSERSRIFIVGVRPNPLPGKSV